MATVRLRLRPRRNEAAADVCPVRPLRDKPGAAIQPRGKVYQARSISSPAGKGPPHLVQGCAEGMACKRDKQSGAVTRQLGGLVPALVHVLVRGTEAVAVTGEYGLRLDEVAVLETRGVAQPAAESCIPYN